MIIGLIAVLFLGGSVITFHKAILLHQKQSHLQSEWLRFIMLKKASERSDRQNLNGMLRQELMEQINRLDLKENILHLDSKEGLTELTLQKLSQEKLLAFLKALNLLQPFKIVKANFVNASSGNLSLELAISPEDTTEEKYS